MPARKRGQARRTAPLSDPGEMAILEGFAHGGNHEPERSGIDLVAATG